jgi:hypothetical protein
VGCTAADERSAGPVVRDSAGIRIVENTAAAWEDGEEWTIDPEPVLTIGGEEDPLFRVSRVVRLSDGRIAVGNSGAFELRFYDADGGALLNTVGREGEGPGEFRHLRGPDRLAGDSLLVWDDRQYRGTVFGPDGNLARLVEIGENPYGYRSPRAVDVFDDGSLLCRASAQDENTRFPGHYAQAFMHCAADGTPLADLGVHRGGACATVDRCIVGLFGPRSSTATGEDVLYYGYGPAFEIQTIGFDGSQRASIRRAYQPIPITDADLEAFKAEMRAALPEERHPAVERIFDEQDVPATMPSFRRMEVDALGHLWVLEYDEARPIFNPFPGAPTRAADRASRWSVFDEEHSFLGTVAVPPELRITQIGRDFVLGVHTDELGVERVRMYRLNRD